MNDVANLDSSWLTFPCRVRSRRYEDPPSKGPSSTEAPSAPPERSGSESPPKRGLGLDEISARLLTLPGHVGPPGSSDGGDGDGDGEGGGNMDDLASRLRRLRG